MRALIFSVSLALSALTAGAEDAPGSWLCLAEHSGGVDRNDGDVIRAGGGTNEERYIVDRNGFGFFGKNHYFLPKCRFSDGKPIFCNSITGENSETWGGTVRFENNHFILYSTGTVVQDDGSWYHHHYINVGTCNQIN